MEVDINFANTFRASSKNAGHRKSRSGTPKNGEDPSVFSQKDKFLTQHLVKQNNPTYGQMPSSPEGECKLMVGESASLTKSKKGRTGKRKTNIQTVEVTLLPMITIAQVHVPR